MIYESQEALLAKLAERYDGPISQRDGPGGRQFSYIPWTETVRRLNAVFGPDGWGTSLPQVIFANGTYTVSLSLSVTAKYLDEDGDRSYFTKEVPGVGSAVARGEGDDNASKAALSDAISRAAKLLGDQFGFFLYEKGATRPMANAAPTNVTGSASTFTGDLGRRPSEKQIAILEKNGIAYEGVPYDEWHSALDAHFERMKARQTASSASW